MELPDSPVQVQWVVEFAFPSPSLAGIPVASVSRHVHKESKANTDGESKS